MAIGVGYFMNAAKLELQPGLHVVHDAFHGWGNPFNLNMSLTRIADQGTAGVAVEAADRFLRDGLSVVDGATSTFDAIPGLREAAEAVTAEHGALAREFGERVPRSLRTYIVGDQRMPTAFRTAQDGRNYVLDLPAEADAAAGLREAVRSFRELAPQPPRIEYGPIG